MAAGTLTKEAVGQTILEKPKTTAGMTPERKRIAEELKKAGAERGPRSATEEASARKLTADRKSAQKNIAENIGKGEVDPVTGKKTLDRAEKIRFNEASTFEGAISDFIKAGKGWEGLSDPQKDMLRPAVLAKVEEWVNSPGAPDYFAGKTDAEKNAIVDQFLSGDLDVFDAVKDLYGERLVSPTEQIGSSTEAQENELKRLGKEIADKDSEKRGYGDQQAKYQRMVDVDFAGYDADMDKVAETGPFGPEAQKIHDIDAKIATDFAPDQVRALKIQKANKEQELARLRENLKAEIKVRGTKGGDVITETPHAGTIRTAIEEVEGELATAAGKLNEYEGLVEDRQALVDRRANAKTQAKDFQDKHNQADEELAGLNKQKAVAEAELGSIKLDRAAAEQAFVDSIKNILPDAVDKVFTDRAKLVEEGYKSYLDAIKANPNADPHVKALAAGLSLRYDKFKEDHGFMHRKRDVVGREPDKKAIQEDLDALKSGDATAAENVVKRALLKATNPDTGKAYTSAEIDSLLASNPDFVKDNIGNVTAGLITKGLQTGQVKAKDMEILVSKGHITEEKMVDAFITHNKKAQEAMKKAGFGGNAKELIKKNPKAMWWILALLTLGSPAAVALGGYSLYKIYKSEKAGDHGDTTPGSHTDEEKKAEHAAHHAAEAKAA